MNIKPWAGDSGSQQKKSHFQPGRRVGLQGTKQSPQLGDVCVPPGQRWCNRTGCPQTSQLTPFALGRDGMKMLLKESSSKSFCPVVSFSWQGGSAATWVVFPHAHKQRQEETIKRVLKHLLSSILLTFLCWLFLWCFLQPDADAFSQQRIKTCAERLASLPDGIPQCPFHGCAVFPKEMFLGRSRSISGRVVAKTKSTKARAVTAATKSGWEGGFGRKIKVWKTFPGAN